MKSLLSSIIAVISFLLLFTARAYPQHEGENIIIGKYHVINSKTLGEERRILVHLPLGYEDTELRYPVVYHLYGDFVMTYFAEAASVIERMHDKGLMPQVILVGIDNTDRYRDLRPYYPSGEPAGIENFIQYFEKELIPFIDGKYRTSDSRILVGPQAGACFGLYTLMEHPLLFDAYLIENSFHNPGVINDYLASKTEEVFASDMEMYSFLFMNLNEESQNYPVAMKIKDHIGSNMPEGFRFSFNLSKKEENLIESIHLDIGFASLFAGYKLPDNIEFDRLDDLLSYYQDLSDKLHIDFHVSDRIIREAGDRFDRTGNKKEERRCYEYMLKHYPHSLDGLFRMANIYIEEGNYLKAREHLQQFLEIRPNESIIRNRLKWVEERIKE